MIQTIMRKDRTYLSKYILVGSVLKISLLLGLLIVNGSRSLYAQELAISYGQTRGIGGDHSATWSLDLKYPLAKHFMWSIGYLNELSIRGRHRDGFLSQAWIHQPFLRDRIDVSAGIGPYFSDDTQSYKGESEIEYAPGYVASLALSFHITEPWVLRLSYNNVQTTSYDSDGLLLGLGYLLPNGQSNRHTSAFSLQPSKRPRRRNEISVFLLRTFINVTSTPRAWGGALEYRRSLGAHLDWTTTLIDEGDAEAIHRRGIPTQLWLTDAFFRESFSLGAGLGPYLHQEDSNGSDDFHVAALASATASYRFSNQWAVRFIFNRVVGDYQLNADVLMLGLGRRWGPGR
ncbi:MAG TPA: hypothetical protein DCZ95_18885 [Verrucomicrobia bacterium]|nr:MAG: hypothetical protein A2X46_17125 [Lentisphaerae bacterium GWF2_57_35]HBA86153.1 hypothetical protein [Verrucomicrobiota bacterium]